MIKTKMIMEYTLYNYNNNFIELRNLLHEILICTKIDKQVYQKYVERLHCRAIVSNIYWYRIRSNLIRKSYH